MKFENLIITFIIIGMFSISLIGFSINLSADNSPNQTITNDPEILNYYTNTTSDILEFYNTANLSESSLGNSPTTSTGSGIIFDTVGGIWKTMKISSVVIFNNIFGLLQTKILGISFNYVIAGIATIFIIVLIFSIIRMVFTGT